MIMPLHNHNMERVPIALRTSSHIGNSRHTVTISNQLFSNVHIGIMAVCKKKSRVIFTNSPTLHWVGAILDISLSLELPYTGRVYRVPFLRLSLAHSG